MGRFEVGKKIFFIENNCRICDGVIVKRAGGFCTIKIGDGGIRLRENRLFETEQEAMEILKKNNSSVSLRRKTPYDYDH